jgi:hypothetical protein
MITHSGDGAAGWVARRRLARPRREAHLYAAARSANTTTAGAAWAIKAAGTTRPTRTALEQRTKLAELIGLEDRLELPLHAGFKLGNLFALVVRQRKPFSNERRNDVTDPRPAPAIARRSVGRWSAKPPAARRCVGRSVGSVGRRSAEPSAARRYVGRAVSATGPATGRFKLGPAEFSVVIVVECFEGSGGIANLIGRQLTVAIGVERGHDGWAGGPRAAFALTGTRPTTTPTHRRRAVAIRRLWWLRQGQGGGKHRGSNQQPARDSEEGHPYVSL